ncbi:hypothetical protein PCHDK_000498500 [Plasmodium chabaudi adami]|uniref:CIR protein n=1 Tax=Plasmodium chabaudi adami TaxID=5826 RepID=A0A1D3L7N6_PLACE|nr:hypothetical protein PCHDK_000498500 [Plasmodium chabaudi adami]
MLEKEVQILNRKFTDSTERSKYYTSLYKKASSTLENVYDKSRNFASNTISYTNEQLNKGLENGPSSNLNGPQSTPSLPDEKQSEPQNTPLQTDQNNYNSQGLLPTQNLDSSNSKQVNPSDSTHEK